MDIIIKNRQAHYQYQIGDTYTAGMVLEGWEVKAIMQGTANFNGASSYIRVSRGEAWLEGMTITPLPSAAMGSLVKREPCRSRKLLLTRQELTKLQRKVTEKKCTLIPLMLKKDRKLKLEIGVATGKRKYEKRETIKERDLTRMAQREFI